MEGSPIIPFKNLNIELCNAKTKRKEVHPMFVNLTYESIPFYYKRWGQIFRKCCNNVCIKNNKYYSMEEVEEIYIQYIIKHKIKPTGKVKEVIKKKVTHR